MKVDIKIHCIITFDSKLYVTGREKHRIAQFINVKKSQIIAIMHESCHEMLT
jgi:hypothetical protein